MTKLVKEFLVEQGWTIVCESPLELEAETEQDGRIGFASGTIAKWVVDSIFELHDLRQEIAKINKEDWNRT